MLQCFARVLSSLLPPLFTPLFTLTLLCRRGTDCGVAIGCARSGEAHSGERGSGVETSEDKGRQGEKKADERVGGREVNHHSFVSHSFLSHSLHHMQARTISRMFTQRLLRLTSTPKKASSSLGTVFGCKDTSPGEKKKAVEPVVRVYVRAPAVNRITPASLSCCDTL
jgi:hypothetical protein